MNANGLSDLARSVVIALGTLAAAKGWGDADLWAGIGGAAALAVGAFWTFYAHKSVKA